MSLSPLPPFPSNASYVLKLSRDAAPQRGRLCGRIEHIISGDCNDFDSTDALLTWLLQHATQALARPGTHSQRNQEATP